MDFLNVIRCLVDIDEKFSLYLFKMLICVDL